MSDVSCCIGYYVSIIRAKKRGLLLGPYASHDEALARVAEGRKMATAVDPWADFDAFGTCRINSNKLPKSIFGS